MTTETQAIEDYHQFNGIETEFELYKTPNAGFLNVPELYAISVI